MSELSTPTVGLQVQSQKAEMRPGPQVDVSGAMRGQPDWQALGEAGRNLGQTVTNLFNDTAAKSAFLEYQKELGDIERNYINSNGNGSPEEIRKVQDLTNKAWSKFQQSTRNLAGSNTYKIIEEANKYGVRFRDSILNNRAKFAEDYYQKNQAALVATNTEDYVFAADDPKSEAFANANAELERNLSELLIHNGFDKDDPLYTKTMADAKSAAILSNIKYHVANQDYIRGWRNYTYYTDNGILTGESRTSALQMLKILKDAQSGSSGGGSSGTNNIIYRRTTGTLKDDDKELFAKEDAELAMAIENVEHPKDMMAYGNQLSAYTVAKAQGAQLLADGSLRTKDGNIIKKPKQPHRKTYLQHYTEAYHRIDFSNEMQNKLYRAGGHTTGAVSLGISELRRNAIISESKGEQGAIQALQMKLVNATPAELFALSGAVSPEFAAQAAEDIQGLMGEDKFSELIDYWRFNTVRSELNWLPARIEAERMTNEEFQDIVKESNERGITTGEVLSIRKQLPLHVANEVAAKLTRYNSDPNNNWGGTNQMELFKARNGNGKSLNKIFSAAYGVDESAAVGFAELEPNKKKMHGLWVEAYNWVVDHNEKLIAAREAEAKKANDKPEQHMEVCYDLIATNWEYQEEIEDKFEALAKEDAAEQQAIEAGRWTGKTETFTAWGNTYLLPSKVTSPNYNYMAQPLAANTPNPIRGMFENPNINMLRNILGAFKTRAMTIVNQGGAAMDATISAALTGPGNDYFVGPFAEAFTPQLDNRAMPPGVTANMSSFMDSATGAALSNYVNGPLAESFTPQLDNRAMTQPGVDFSGAARTVDMTMQANITDLRNRHDQVEQLVKFVDDAIRSVDNFKDDPFVHSKITAQELAQEAVSELNDVVGSQLPDKFVDDPFARSKVTAQELTQEVVRDLNDAVGPQLPEEFKDDPFAHSQVTAQELARDLNYAVGSQLTGSFVDDPFAHSQVTAQELARDINNAVGRQLPDRFVDGPFAHAMQISEALTKVEAAMNIVGQAWGMYGDIIAVGGNTYAPGIGIIQNHADYDTLWNRTLVLYNAMGDMMRYAVSLQGIRESDADYQKMVKIRESLANIMGKISEYQINAYKEHFEKD